MRREGQWLNVYNNRSDETSGRVAKDRIDLCSISRVSPRPTSRVFAVELGNNLKSFVFRANSNGERDAWMDAFAVWIPVSLYPGFGISIPTRTYEGILACVYYIIEHGMEETGVFRIPGSVSNIEEIYEFLNIFGEEYFTQSLLPPEFTVHDVASAMKKTMRQLPEGILTFRLTKKFHAADSASQVKDLIAELPEQKRFILFCIALMCTKLNDNLKCTKMSPGALAVCLGPAICAQDDFLFLTSARWDKFFHILINDFRQIFVVADESEHSEDDLGFPKEQYATENLLEDFSSLASEMKEESDETSSIKQRFTRSKSLMSSDLRLQIASMEDIESVESSPKNLRRRNTELIRSPGQRVRSMSTFDKEREKLMGVAPKKQLPNVKAYSLRVKKLSRSPTVDEDDPLSLLKNVAAANRRFRTLLTDLTRRISDLGIEDPEILETIERLHEENSIQSHDINVGLYRVKEVGLASGEL